MGWLSMLENKLPQGIVQYAELELLMFACHWRMFGSLPERLFLQACASCQRSLLHRRHMAFEGSTGD